jgi:hypothetical protein
LINKKHQRLIYRRVPEEPKEKRTQNNWRSNGKKKKKNPTNPRSWTNTNYTNTNKWRLDTPGQTAERQKS